MTTHLRIVWTHGALAALLVGTAAPTSAQVPSQRCHQAVRPIEGEAGYSARELPAGASFLCEGFVETDVFDPGAEVWLAHLTDSENPVVPGPASVTFAWAPDPAEGTVRIRAQSIPDSLDRDYRMDAAVPGTVHQLRWLSVHFLSHEVPFGALAFTAWTDPQGGCLEPVYQVLSADSALSSGRDVRMGFLSNRRVENATLEYGLEAETETDLVTMRTQDGSGIVGAGDLIVFELRDVPAGLHLAEFGAQVAGDPDTPLAETVCFVVR